MLNNLAITTQKVCLNLSTFSYFIMKRVELYFFSWRHFKILEQTGNGRRIVALKAPGGSTLQWARNDVFCCALLHMLVLVLFLVSFFQYLLLVICEASYNEFCFVKVHLLATDFFVPVSVIVHDNNIAGSCKASRSTMEADIDRSLMPQHGFRQTQVFSDVVCSSLEIPSVISLYRRHICFFSM